MAHSTFEFQHSVLYIDSLINSQNYIRTGLLGYPVQFEFCPSILDEAILSMQHGNHDMVVVSIEFHEGLVLDFAQHIQKKYTHVPTIYMVEPRLIEIQNQLLETAAVECFQRPKDASGLIENMDRAYRTSREREFRKTQSKTLAG